jgi:hypothetical protein
LAGDWLLVPVCYERKELLTGCWWLVSFERKVLLTGCEAKQIDLMFL